MPLLEPTSMALVITIAIAMISIFYCMVFVYSDPIGSRFQSLFLKIPPMKTLYLSIFLIFLALIPFTIVNS